MTTIRRNIVLSLLAVFAFLLWNYPLIDSVFDNHSIWIKMLYLFGTWLLIVLLTRKWTFSDKQE